jgi:hypothetical protein
MSQDRDREHENDIPPLAPDDRPFDWDEDEPKPFILTRWWTLIAIVVVLSLIVALASPIIGDWL